jgi:hypothetical protein
LLECRPDIRAAAQSVVAQGALVTVQLYKALGGGWQ